MHPTLEASGIFIRASVKLVFSTDRLARLSLGLGGCLAILPAHALVPGHCTHADAHGSEAFRSHCECTKLQEFQLL